jgi:hypothetical protein
MTHSRLPWPARAIVLLPLAAVACGGGGTPLTTTPVTTLAAPAPDPAPTVGGTPVAAACPIGKGEADAACAKKAPQLKDAVEAAIDRLVREQPRLFDLQQESFPGSAQYRVLDAEAYHEGVLANLRASGHCAERALEREHVAVKRSNEFSEEYEILSGSGFVRRGNSGYVRTCTPASFPFDLEDVFAYVRLSFYHFECDPGIRTPGPGIEGTVPVGCHGLLTATPKQKNHVDVPAWLHGNEVEWTLEEGHDVVRLTDYRPPNVAVNPFNVMLHATSAPGQYRVCAKVKGFVGCLSGRTER